MKITTKVLSLILVFCMLFSTFGYAATYSDVSVDDANYAPISLLSSLGIIKGYEDGTFGPDKNVTRAEFTVMLMRTLNLSNLGSNDPAGLPFNDCEVVKDWAVSDIRTAYDLGIIKGMDEVTFAPNDNVTNEQALKMIVCSMGYEPMAIDYAGGVENVWPTGYTTVANQILLTKGVSSAYDAPAKRVEIARYIYNALDIDLMKQTVYTNGMVKNEIQTGVNILNDKLKITHQRGELLADTESTVLEGGAVARDGEVVILPEGESNSKTFKIGEISTKGLVGRTIDFYYEETVDGERNMVHIIDATKSSAVFELDPDDIDAVKSDWDEGVEIAYWASVDDRNTTKLKIAANPVLSINGRVVDLDSITPIDAFTIDSGSIELIDSNSAGSYNKINIVSYKTFVVGSVSSSSKMIIDYYRTTADGNTCELDADDTKTTLTMTRASNGSSVSLSSLKKFDVISVKETNGTNGRMIKDVVVSSEKVTGKINSIDLSTQKISVDGKEYKISNYAVAYASSQLNALSVNDNCNFYLDKDGKIAAFEKSADDSNTVYAYICGVAAEPGDDVATFKVIDQTGSKKTMAGASRVRIDGTSYSDPEDVVDVLKSVVTSYGNIDGKSPADTNNSQLAKITKNSTGAISAIDTLLVLDPDDESDLKLSKSFGTNNKYKYKSSTKTFTSTSGDTFMIDSNTIIFSVPSNREKYNDYAKRTVTYFKDGESYGNMEVFDIGTSSASKAKCVVIYGGSSAESLTADSPLLIVTAVSAANTSAGSVHRVEGYMFGDGTNNGAEIVETYTNADGIFNNASVGDVYRVAYTDQTFNTNTKRLVKASGSSMDNSFYTEYDAKGDYTVVHGLLVGADDDTFVLAQTDDIFDLVDDEVNGTTDVARYTFSVNADTVFATLEKSRDYYVSVSNDNILMAMESFDDTKQFIQDDGEGDITADGVAATEIFAYILDDEVVLVYRVIRNN